ncbi:MAG TPA: hypothetical protein VGI70_22220, partial [Polyangiales bacterium]
RQLDEYNRILPELPQREDPLGLANPLQPALKELQPAELDTLQLVINYGQFQAVLDRSPRTDLETAQTLLTLMQKDYVTVRH